METKSAAQPLVMWGFHEPNTVLCVWASSVDPCSFEFLLSSPEQTSDLTARWAKRSAD